MESSDFEKADWNKQYGFPYDSKCIKKAFSTGKFDVVIPRPSEIEITR